MENYYKILEVDKDASPEIIEKAYKTLVKRYHPDIQTDLNKEEAENKIKKINEAYDVLSDNLKRENYNKELNNTYVSVEEYNLIINENIELKNELNNIKNQINNSANYNTTKPYNNIYNQAYSNNNYYKNYKVNTNNIVNNNYNPKSFFRFIFSLCLTGLIIFIVLHIPFIYSLIFDSDIPFTMIIILFILFYYFKKH